MSATIILHRTYNPHDCTSVGWRVEWHGRRLMAERRSRWQGSRDGVRVMVGRMSLSDAQKWVTESLPGILADTMGDLAHAYPVTDRGYIVR